MTKKEIVKELKIILEERRRDYANYLTGKPSNVHGKPSQALLNKKLARIEKAIEIIEGKAEEPETTTLFQ